VFYQLLCEHQSMADRSTAPRAPAAATSLWSLCWRSLIRPRQTARVIAASADLRQGWTVVTGFAALYSVAALTSYLTGRRPQRPLLRFISAERYYLWESLFITPVTVAWMTLFASLARSGARRAGGSGTYESDFTVLAIGHTMPLIAGMWLPDMTCYLLRVDERRYRRLVAVYAPAATAWALALSTLGICEAERISCRKAAVTVLAADVVSAVVSGVVFVMR
jgi:hypothetical protein